MTAQAHTHAHTHDGSSHNHEVRLDPAVAAKPAVLELGADVGAAVIYTAAALNGRELEIKPADADWNGAHTAVRRRPGAADHEPVFAALFYGLAEGPYELRVKGGTEGAEHERPRSITIVGGSVVETTW